MSSDESPKTLDQSDLVSMVIAQAAASNATSSQGKLTTIYGPGYLNELDEMDKRWDQKESKRRAECLSQGKHYTRKEKPNRKRSIPSYEEDSDQKVFLINTGEFIRASPPPGKSLLFHGLKGSYITIYTKANKVTISHCKNVRIHLLGGTVSGLDVIRCENIYIEVPYVNSANLELASSASLVGNTDSNSRITCISCMNVSVNGTQSAANIFRSISMDGDLNVGSIHPDGWPSDGGLDAEVKRKKVSLFGLGPRKS